MTTMPTPGNYSRPTFSEPNNNSEKIEQTFVYEGTEVLMTERRAQRKLKSGTVDELVEVTPTDKSVGSWKKWVKESDLYKIQK